VSFLKKLNTRPQALTALIAGIGRTMPGKR
jgi:hypothetical protein